jgi:glucose-1-phosphate cytidylyltransferase
MKVVILAGGLGTRLAEETATRPKPMVDIGGRPVLWHIMKTYAHFGYGDFIICLGYKAEVAKDFFLNYARRLDDFTVSLQNGEAVVHSRRGEPWQVTLVDTGLGTATGGRLRRVADFIGDSPFFATYGDGLADVDIGRLLAFHRRAGRLATLTAVRPAGRFGSLELDGDQVTRFAEKPAGGEGWINAGFFVFEAGLLPLVLGDETVLESEVLGRLALRGQLAAYRHAGFWHPMDTLRDLTELRHLWDESAAPWKVWK